jgi:hypothetical protein
MIYADLIPMAYADDVCIKKRNLRELIMNKENTHDSLTGNRNEGT